MLSAMQSALNSQVCFHKQIILKMLKITTFASLTAILNLINKNEDILINCISGEKYSQKFEFNVRFKKPNDRDFHWVSVYDQKENKYNFIGRFQSNEFFHSKDVNFKDHHIRMLHYLFDKRNESNFKEYILVSELQMCSVCKTPVSTGFQKCETCLGESSRGLLSTRFKTY